jgi:hypothetical protein
MGSSGASARHCSLAGAHAWTDQLTNVVTLAPTGLQDHLAELLSTGGAPRGVFLDFLHETTHQWCFNSPVGFSVAYLQARALCLAAFASRGAPVGTRDVLDAAVRVEASRELLRPLAEGLAMFVELDAITSAETEVFSLPLEATPLLFGTLLVDEATAREDPRRTVTRLVTDVLGDERLSDDALRRRLRLLTEPLAVTTESHGYLAGYLTVKHLLFGTADRSNAGFLLEDSDLFVCFLRAWIYRDFQLVHHLLTEDRLDVEVVEPLASHIAARLRSFASDADMQRDLAHFEVASELKVYETTTLGREAAPEWLHADNDTYMAGVAAVQHVEDYARGEAGNELDRIYRLVVSTLMETRHYVDLGAVDCHLEVDATGRARVLIADRVVWEPEVDPSWAGEGPGRLEVMYSTLASHARQVVLTREDELLAGGVFALGNDDADQRAGHIRRLMREFSRVLEVRRFLQEAEPLLDEFLERPHLREAMADVRARLPRIADAIYGPFAVAGSAAAETCELGELGMAGLPGAGREVLEGAALLGLANAAAVDVDDLAEVFQERGLSWEGTLRWLETAAACGVPRLVVGPTGRPHTSL